MSWKNTLHTLFGLEDRPFSQHPSDIKTAYKLLGVLIEQGIGMSSVEKEVRSFLKGNKHLDADKQINEVKRFFRPWLLD